MKRFVIVSLILLLGFGAWTIAFGNEPKIVDGTEVTSSTIVTDRAMSEGMPYLSVEFPDGNALCLWDPSGNVIPDGVSIGETVVVTYGEQEGYDGYILISVKMDTA